MEPEHWAALNREDYRVPYALANIKEIFANGQVTIAMRFPSTQACLRTQLIGLLQEQRPEVMDEMLSMWIDKTKHKEN